MSIRHGDIVAEFNPKGHENWAVYRWYDGKWRYVSRHVTVNMATFVAESTADQEGTKTQVRYVGD